MDKLENPKIARRVRGATPSATAAGDDVRYDKVEDDGDHSEK